MSNPVELPRPAGGPSNTDGEAPNLHDKALVVFARLMEGGQEEEETCRELDELTTLLKDDTEAQQRDKGHRSICSIIDADCLDTVLCYLDMRQPDAVRGHATLTTAAYLKAAGDDGSSNLSTFFFGRVSRGTYDDYIVAFCVASAMFPIVPDLTAKLFLSEGFLGSLGHLMRRRWKSRKVETACLEMLSTACISPPCRDAVQKYCVEWLEEVVDQDPTGDGQSSTADPKVTGEGGSISMRRHSEQVQHLAALILAKLRVTSARPTASTSPEPQVEPAVTSIEDLSALFLKVLQSDNCSDRPIAVEGLAFSSVQPAVKDSISKKPYILDKIVQTLADAHPTSPTTYGALTIFVNLTKYQPSESEEEKRMNQLKAYANAASQVRGPDPLEDDEHVSMRCRAVFDARLVPVLVSHSNKGSAASLALITSILHSLSMDKNVRGALAQQGAVKLLISVSTELLPESAKAARRTAAQALARILISTDPHLVFGGNSSIRAVSAVAPLVLLLAPEPASDRRDLLPTFESLMALTNLASLPDVEARSTIIRTAWSLMEEQLLASNHLVCRAAIQLLCNLVQETNAAKLYAIANPRSKERINILVALADAEDDETRSAAGGALASLTSHIAVASYIKDRERGLRLLLNLCTEGDESIRHRGAVCIYNLAAYAGTIGEELRAALKEEGGIETLKNCFKLSRTPAVLEATAEALKALVDGYEEPN